MKSINIYLTFDGTCEEAFQFYKSIFGGEFDHISKFRDMPPMEGVELTEDQLDRVMHVSYTLGPSMVLMGSDTGGEWAPPLVVGNNFSISLTVDTKEEADNLYEQLSTGGHVTMPMDNTFWGDYFGMCSDKYNVNWMISYNENNN